MLAAWTILVNRRQEKLICTKPAIGGEKPPPRLQFSLDAAGNFKPPSDVINSGSERNQIGIDGSSKSKC